MEVVLPAVMTVQESHDIALVLQHKLESFDEVERAFVHGNCKLSRILPSLFLRTTSNSNRQTLFQLLG